MSEIIYLLLIVGVSFLILKFIQSGKDVEIDRAARQFVESKKRRVYKPTRGGSR